MALRAGDAITVRFAYSVYRVAPVVGRAVDVVARIDTRIVVTIEAAGACDDVIAGVGAHTKDTHKLIWAGCLTVRYTRSISAHKALSTRCEATDVKAAINGANVVCLTVVVVHAWWYTLSVETLPALVTGGVVAVIHTRALCGAHLALGTGVDGDGALGDTVALVAHPEVALGTGLRAGIVTHATYADLVVVTVVVLAAVPALSVDTARVAGTEDAEAQIDLTLVNADPADTSLSLSTGDVEAAVRANPVYTVLCGRTGHVGARVHTQTVHTRVAVVTGAGVTRVVAHAAYTYERWVAVDTEAAVRAHTVDTLVLSVTLHVGTGVHHTLLDTNASHT